MNKEDKQAILDCMLLMLHKTNDFDDLIELTWVRGEKNEVVATWQYPNLSREKTYIDIGRLNGASFISEVLKHVRYIR